MGQNIKSPLSAALWSVGKRICCCKQEQAKGMAKSTESDSQAQLHGQLKSTKQQLAQAEAATASAEHKLQQSQLDSSASLRKLTEQHAELLSQVMRSNNNS